MTNCSFFIIGVWTCTVLAQPPSLVTNSLAMKLALIPAGSFTMGSSPDEPNRQADESSHQVVITRPFYIGATEVTQRQWRLLDGLDKSYFKGDSLPVEKVSWQEASAFCQKLSRQEGRTYRLPTEAEWEYACRAGSALNWVDENQLAEQAWYSANSDEMTHAVAMKKANTWGLFDMLGNVAEWCADFYMAEYPSAVSYPQGPISASYRVIRGGSWSSFAAACRCASRSDAPASYQLKQTGFRVVMELE